MFGPLDKHLIRLQQTPFWSKLH